MRNRYSSFLVAISAVVLSAQAPVTWRIRDVPPELRTVEARADLMIEAMHDSVLRELADALAQGGADLAMKSCHLDSVLMTQRLGRRAWPRAARAIVSAIRRTRRGPGRRRS